MVRNSLPTWIEKKDKLCEYNRAVLAVFAVDVYI